MTATGLVVVGGSWGGLDAACALLAALPPVPAVPVVLVLHRARSSDARVIDAVVRRSSGHRVAELEDKEPLLPGPVRLAPPDYHLLVEPGTVSLSTEAPVNHCRPSIDLALESAADAYGPLLVGVVLSGVGRDGAAGIRRVSERGGTTLVQAPETAERRDMPEAAVATARIDLIAAPAALGARIAALTGVGR